MPERNAEVCKKQNILLSASALAFCILLLRPLRASFVIAPSVTALLAFALLSCRTPGDSRPDQRNSSGYRPAAVLLAACLGALFLIVWLRTKRLVSLSFFDLRAALPYFAAACVGVLGSIPFLTALLCRAATTVQAAPAGDTRNTERRLNGEDRRLLFCVALVSVSVCSLCSPLYPFNDWVDANCFFTVGKSMLSGIVPYRDLYEQKGPLLYALYALCYPISHRSFLGAWLLEVAAAWAFLDLAWRSQQLLTGKRDPLFLFLTAALVYTAPAFLKGGSAEELSLPLLMLSFYYGLRAVYRNRDLSFREGFFIGLSSGAVLWIKYSMLGFYIGFILVPAWRMLRGGRGLSLLKLLLMIFLGVLTASIPVFAYFAYHGALSSLWEAYFYNNIFVYGKASSLLNTAKGLASGFASMLTYNDATILLMLFSLLRLKRRGERALGLHVFLSFCFAFGMIYAGGINLKYYSEILCIFIPLGVAQFLGFCDQLRRQNLSKASVKTISQQRLSRILIPILFTAALLGSENSGMLFQHREQMPQFVFAEALKEEPDATLFNYGALDIGLYTTADILPTTKYFCMLNLPSEEMIREVEHYMADGVTDYIVSRELEVDSPCYTLLQTVWYSDSGTLYPYYLYRHT